MRGAPDGSGGGGGGDGGRAGAGALGGGGGLCGAPLGHAGGGGCDIGGCGWFAGSGGTLAALKRTQGSTAKTHNARPARHPAATIGGAADDGRRVPDDGRDDRGRAALAVVTRVAGLVQCVPIIGRQVYK